MKANIIFDAFLATGWFIEPKPALIDEIKSATKAIIHEKIKLNELSFINVSVRLCDLSREGVEPATGETERNSHYKFVDNFLGIGNLRWDASDPYKNVLVTGIDQICIAGFPFSKRFVMPGLIRDLKYLASPMGSGIRSVIFLSEFLNNPFFKTEIMVFKDLGYDVWIYHENEGVLIEATNGSQQGGDNDAKDETNNVYDPDDYTPLTDLITRKRKGGSVDGDDSKNPD